MEEILASIRRIISEDETPEGGEAAAEGTHEPMAAAAPAPEPEAHEDDVLELTDRVDPIAPAETLGDLEINPLPEIKAEEPPPPEPEPAPVAAAPPPPIAADEPLVGDPAAYASAMAFGKLSDSLAMPAHGRTLEDVVRELLRPLLKAWLDEHLPGIVQATVDQEVERIARGRVR